jgi:hypothetical protein
VYVLPEIDKGERGTDGRMKLRRREDEGGEDDEDDK